jgi:predicted transcriptional regulator
MHACSQRFSQREAAKIFTLRVLLKLIAEEKCQIHIANTLAWSKQKTNYWFRKLLNKGFIRDKVRSNIKIYELTEKGKEFLTRSEGAFNFSLFLHGLGLKFPIVESSRAFDGLNWKDVKLKNWTKKTTTYLGLEGEYHIERTPTNLIVWCKGLVGTDPYKLFFESFNDILSFPSVLYSKYGVRLGSPSLVGKPHFGLVDPLFARLNKIVLVNGLEEWTDNSPCRGPSNSSIPGE